MDYSSLPRLPGDPDHGPDHRREVSDRSSASAVGSVLLAAVAAIAAGTYLSLRLLLRFLRVGPPL